MGLIVDTNVFISLERRNAALDISSSGATGEIYISAITASELLMGVHRADNQERRSRRSKFVEAIFAAIPVLDFTMEVARIHAQLHASLSTQGKLIGAHDLIIAATALHHDFALLTDNVAEFRRVDGLHIVELK